MNRFNEWTMTNGRFIIFLICIVGALVWATLIYKAATHPCLSAVDTKPTAPAYESCKIDNR